MEVTNVRTRKESTPLSKFFTEATHFPWIKTIIVAIIAGIIGALLVLGIGKPLIKLVLTMKVLLFIKFQIVMVAIS